MGLSKQTEGASFNASKAVAALVPAYTQLLHSLKGLGVPEVQIHEPVLTTHKANTLKADFESSFSQLAAVGLPIDLVTYYDDVGVAYPWVVQLPVQVRCTCCSPLGNHYQRHAPGTEFQLSPVAAGGLAGLSGRAWLGSGVQDGRSDRKARLPGRQEAGRWRHRRPLCLGGRQHTRRCYCCSHCKGACACA